MRGNNRFSRSERFQHNVRHGFGARGYDHCPCELKGLPGGHGGMHGNPLRKPGRIDHRGVFVPVRPIADNDALQRLAEAAFRFGKRLDEDVWSLEVAQHADIEETGSAFTGGDGLEFALLHPIIDHCGAGARHAHLGLVSRLLEMAYETERVGETLLKALQPQKELPFHAVSGVMQATAMRRIKAGYAIPVHPQK